MNNDINVKWEELAKRNNWNLSVSDGRPYFMKDGNYVTPSSTTSQQDKEELATIISEESSELARLIVACWDNGFKISGPCSGITDAHTNAPFYLHFAVIAPAAIAEDLHSELSGCFPNFSHMLRGSENDEIRYDISYHFKNGKGLTVIESNAIFSVMNEKLELVLDKKKKAPIR